MPRISRNSVRIVTFGLVFICAFCTVVAPTKAAQRPTMLVSAYATVSINMLNYVTQPLNGSMLCTSTGGLECFTSYYREGEFEFLDQQSTQHDYYAVFYYTSGTRTVYQLGIVRSFANGLLQCFSAPTVACTAPPTSFNTPGAVPETIVLNSVPYSTELAAENNGTCCKPVQKYANAGTPKTTIAGAIVTTGGGSYLPFQTNDMNITTCAQYNEGSTQAYVTAVFVTGIPFGGSVGTQNAVVIDEYEQGGTPQQNHMERYYYVQGFGRVREGASGYDPNTGVYDLWVYGAGSPNNRNRNTLVTPSTVKPQPNQCPQNSTPPLG